MKYHLHHVWRARRGKVPEVMEDIKAVNGLYISWGNTTGRIYVDMTGSMDTVVFDIEADSLDQFYAMERGVYVDPTPEFARLAAHLNENSVMGSREIYEVIL